VKDASSRELFDRALRVTPGGVNSPVRAMRAVRDFPLFAERGEGPIVYDADGNAYIDLLNSWGPLILGHGHPAVVEAIREQAGRALTFGIASRLEVELAEFVTGAMPSVEEVRFVSSGTEATMSAIRLARAYTGRNVVVKFAGCYHGHVDALLARAGSGAALSALPVSPGVPPKAAEDTVVLPYNDLQAVEELLLRRGSEVACIIVEPIAANMGVVPPGPGYLEGLRRATAAAGALLIFDEVITGFRVGLGGAQEAFSIAPDLTCLGKVIGGGLPVGAYGGRREIMERIAPIGDVYQAGTLSGSPLAMAAGLAQLTVLREAEGAFERLYAVAETIGEAMRRAAADAGVTATVQVSHGLFTCFFTEGPIENQQDSARTDARQYRAFWQSMASRGVLFAPAANEAAFPSLALTDAHVHEIIAALPEAMRAAKAVN
jgi:glutamate-1-semialdehyde 2,1-aminomutase